MNLSFTLAGRYLSGRKLRTFLTTLAVIFGVLVIFAMNTILPGMLRAFQLNILAASGQVDLTITHVTGESFSADRLADVQSVEGVKVAAGSLDRIVGLPTDFFDKDPAKPDVVSVLNVAGVDPDSAQAMHVYFMDEGRFLAKDDQGAAVIARSLAKILNISLGDTLVIPSTLGEARLTIVGLLPERTTPGNEQVLIPLTYAQEIFSQPGQINTIEANLTTLDETRRLEIQRAVEARLGGNYKIGALPSGSELFGSLQMAGALFNTFGFLALFMGAFIIYNTFRTIVAERRRDIGMLRAVGASKRTILGITLAESLLQGLFGTLAGMVFGFLIAWLLMKAVSPVVEQFIRIRLGTPEITPQLVLLTIFLGVGMTLLAGLLPAMQASRVTPLEALRPSTAEVEYRKVRRFSFWLGLVLAGLAVASLLSGVPSVMGPGSLALLFGLVLLAPALITPLASFFGSVTSFLFARDGTGELAEGNLKRQPTRAAITAGTTMIGLAIIVTAASTATSMTGSMKDMIKKTLGSDYLLIPPSIAVWNSSVGADRNLVEELHAVPGIGPISTLRYANSATQTTISQAIKKPGVVQAGENGQVAVSMMGIDPQTFPQVSGLRFLDGDESSAYAALASGRSLIANGTFIAQTGAKVGDTVELVTLQGKQAYKIVAVATDYLNVKITTAFISQAVMQADFNTTEDRFIQFNLAEDANRPAADAQIKQIVSAYPQFRLVEGSKYYQETVKLFDSMFVGLAAMLALLTVPSVIAMLNTLAIGVIERTREIGLLRAIGATRIQVQRIVLIESILLAAIGTAFGLVGGLYLGRVLIAILGDYFPVYYMFPVDGILVGIAAGLIFGVLSAIIPARQASRMQIVEALRYE